MREYAHEQLITPYNRIMCACVLKAITFSKPVPLSNPCYRNTNRVVAVAVVVAQRQTDVNKTILYLLAVGQTTAKERNRGWQIHFVPETFPATFFGKISGASP